MNATVDGVALNDTGVLTGSLSRAQYGTLAGEQVGGYAIGQGSVSANANYTLSFAGNTLTINPAALSVAADAQSKTYGTNDPALTYNPTGLVNGTVDGVALDDTGVLTGSLSRAQYGTLAGEQVGGYAIGQGSVSANANYTLSFTGNTLTVNPAALTVAADAQSKTYGTNDPALTYQASGLVNATVDGVALNDAGVLTGSLSRAQYGTLAGEQVGGYAIGQGSVSANANYTLSFTGNTLTINPAALTVAADAQSKTYGTNDPTLTYQASGLVNGTVDGVALNDTGVLTGSLSRAQYGTLAGEQVGGYAIGQGSVSANANYTLSFTGNTLTVNPAALTVAADVQSKTYGTNDPALTYNPTGLVNATVDGVALNDTGVLTGSLSRAQYGTVAGEQVGGYAIGQGSVSANANYTLSFTGNTLTVNPAALTVAADAQSKTYGTNDPALTYQASGLVNATVDGVALNDAGVLTGSLSRAQYGTLAGEQVGGYAIGQGSVSANANYTLSFTGNTLTINPAALTVAADAQGKTYGTNDPTLTYQASGLVNATVDGVALNDTGVLTGSLSRAQYGTLAGEQVGGYAIGQGSVSANANYTLSFAGNTLTINPAALSVAADAQSKTYGTNDPALTYNPTGLVNGTVDGVALDDTGVLTGSLSRAQYGTLAGEQVGGYAIGQGSVSANANYTLSFTGNTLTVNPAALTVAADAQSKTYGTNDPALTYQASGLVNATVDGVALNDAGVLTGSLSRAQYGTLAGEQVGGYAIGQGSVSANANYTLSFTGNTLTINPAALTVAADAQGKTYGTNDPTLTYQASGLVNGTVDGVALNDTGVLTGSLSRAQYGTLAGEQVGGYAIGQGSVSANANYTLSFTGNTLTVNPAALTVAADVQGKTYGTNDPTLTYQASGLVNATVDGVALNDTGVLTGSLSRAQYGTVAGEQVGGYAIGQGSVSANANYTLSFAGNTLTVNPAALTVAADAQSKTYGTNDPALTYQASGLVNATVDGVALNDAGVLTGSLSRAAGETVTGGPYAITQGTLAANGNYTIAYVGADLTINPLAVILSGERTYDGTTSAAAGILAINNNLDGANLTLSGAGTLTSKDAGTNSFVSGAGLSLGGSAAGNYTLAGIAANGSAVTIDKATLTYVADPLSTTVGNVALDLSGNVTGFVAGDNLANSTIGALGFTTTATGSSAAGQYAISGGGLSAIDYTFTQAPANVTALTVEAAIQSHQLALQALVVAVLPPPPPPPPPLATGGNAEAANTGTTTVATVTNGTAAALNDIAPTSGGSGTSSTTSQGSQTEDTQSDTATAMMFELDGRPLRHVLLRQRRQAVAADGGAQRRRQPHRPHRPADRGRAADAVRHGQHGQWRSQRRCGILQLGQRGVLAMRRWLTSAFAAAALCAPLASAGADELVVVEARGIGLHPGDMVDATKPLALREGQHVTFIAVNGATFKLDGPYDKPPTADLAGGGNTAEALRALVTQEQARIAEAGAARSGATTAHIPAPWLMDVSRSGNVCLRQNHEAVFWRPDGAGPGELTVMPGDRSWKAEVTWPAGDDSIPGPSGVPLHNGTTYLVSLNGGPSAAVRINLVPDNLLSDAMRAAWMAHQGCEAQAEALSRNGQ